MTLKWIAAPKPTKFKKMMKGIDGVKAQLGLPENTTNIDVIKAMIVDHVKQYSVKRTKSQIATQLGVQYQIFYLWSKTRPDVKVLFETK